MGYLYDTHFHLDLQKNKSEAIREIEEKQIYTIAVTNLPDLYRKESIEIASKYIRFALGFHPELLHLYKEQIPLMWEFLSEARYIGEVGLDFVDTTHKEEQIAFFNELVERCRYDSSKIVTIHSRCAVKQVLEIIGDSFRFKPILHWFTGTQNELHYAIERGFFFSVNGAMMASKKFKSFLTSIPKERLLLETDSPFTHFKNTHSDELLRVALALVEEKESINLRNNFRYLLSQ